MLIIIKGDTKGAQKLKELGYKVLDLDKNRNAIDTHYEEIDKEDEVIFWYPASKHKEVKKYVRRVGRWRSKAIKGKLPSTLSDKAISEAIENAEEWKIRGLVFIGDVEDLEPENLEYVPSSLAEFNQKYRGHQMGKLTIWTGARGSGKSTFLSQEVIAAIESGYKIFWYSAELQLAETKYWLQLQAAGLGGIETHIDNNGAEYEKIKKDVLRKINKWIYKEVIFFDKRDIDPDDYDGIFELMLEAYRKYNCRVFIIDNLMTISYSEDLNKLDSDFYRAQTKFVKLLKDFATIYDVHVHLAAHPKKTDEVGLIADANQILGGTGIADLADNVFSLNLVKDEIAEELDKYGIQGCDTIMCELKSRFHNRGGAMMALRFDVKTKRFFQTDEERFRQWSWNKGYGQQSLDSFSIKGPEEFEVDF